MSLLSSLVRPAASAKRLDSFFSSSAAASLAFLSSFPPLPILVIAPGPNQIVGSKATLSVASIMPDMTLYCVLLGSEPTVLSAARPRVKDLPLISP